MHGERWSGSTIKWVLSVWSSRVGWRVWEMIALPLKFKNTFLLVNEPFFFLDFNQYVHDPDINLNHSDLGVTQ